ncbi:MAG: BamA/TamA family outer membrane protein [Alphaproteobacteria bacterium]|nr:BamA/TamA family outer membrane protein [Alphaproteobacteria bacterium]
MIWSGYNGIRVFLLLSMLLGISGCQWVDAPDKSDPANENHAESGIPYTTVLIHPLNSDTESALRNGSTLIKLENRPPISEAGLIKRAEKDVVEFKKILASMGYFSGTVDFEIHMDESPVRVEFRVVPGPLYKIGSVNLLCSNDPAFMADQTPLLTADIIGLHVDDTVNLLKVQAGRERIKKYFQKSGYPFVDIGEPEAIVDHQNHLLHIHYFVTTGQIARIAHTNITGLSHLSSAYVHNRVLWKDGQIYNQALVDKTRRKLLSTGLLATINIAPEKQGQADQGQEQPIVLHVKATESAPRELGACVRYATSEGIGGHIFWRHNNVGGHGQRFEASLKSTKLEKKAKISYDIPDFLTPQQSLMNEVSVVRETTRAYSGHTTNAGMRLQRPLFQHVTGSLGVVGEKGRIQQETTVYNTRLVGLPGDLKIDTTDDLLDPTSGFRANGKVTPYWGRADKNRGMVIGQAGASAYLPFMTNEIGESRGVLAGFIRGGSIFMQNTNGIPPNKRFYSGGGGSVRGYGYQLLGPLDTLRTPLGGRSLAELGAELRLKASETIGFVTFLEGGSVTTNKIPDFKDKTLLWGAGFGGRYYSPIGPIRLDIAFPLKRRRDSTGNAIDRSYQFYVSIGQAF